MIGVFDSGFGGLTVLKYFLRDLPDYNYVYLGDNARAPYGSKSPEAILRYTKEAVDFLFKKNCSLIIVACNTASAQALRKIQQEYLPQKYPNQRVLGVIRPLVEEVAKKSDIKRVGVLGTKATINSHVYKTELHKTNPGLEVLEKSAPLLVSLIEEGWQKKPETKKILKKYLRPLKEKKAQALILACTHYPILLKEIRKIMGKNCEIWDSGEIIAVSLRDYLARHQDLVVKDQKKAKVKFYTSDNVKDFKKLGEKFLSMKISDIEKIIL